MYPHGTPSGRPWAFFWDEGLGASDIVIPKAFRRENAPAAGDPFTERWQLVVRGLAYTVTTGTGPLGVKLVEVTPGGATRTIWECSAVTAATVSGGFQCEWYLTPASNSSPAGPAARLRVEPVGAVVAAKLTVWGVHMPAEGTETCFSTPPFTYS